MIPFDINFIDHVAIRVKNIQTSIGWYTKILGLKVYKLEKWGDYPVFMLSGKTGIAIFPSNPEDEKLNQLSRNVKIDHFAFNVSNEGFIKAKEYFRKIEEPFKFQDHYYFHSVYLKDPDEHTVELTTLVTKENSFYK